MDQPDGDQPPSRRARADQAGIAIENLQRLWAPWRFGYVASSEPLAGCPFCGLPERGPERDRESLILHRGTHTYVVLNAYPYNPGHLMTVPYAHVGDLGGLGEDAAAELWDHTRRAVDVLGERLGCQGVNLGANFGSAAGAGIADHLHLHAVPRWEGDTNFMSVAGATRVLPRALEDVYDELAGAFG